MKLEKSDVTMKQESSLVSEDSKMLSIFLFALEIAIKFNFQLAFFCIEMLLIEMI